MGSFPRGTMWPPWRRSLFLFIFCLSFYIPSTGGSGRITKNSEYNDSDNPRSAALTRADDTPQECTGGGGHHLFYTLPEDADKLEEFILSLVPQERKNRQRRLSYDTEPVVKYIQEALTRLSERLRRLHGKRLNYDEGAFKKLGCISVAEFGLHGMSGVVALFESAFLARVNVSSAHVPADASSMHAKADLCVKPLRLSIHEQANPKIPNTGVYNDKGECKKNALGGRYDPGLACGPEGSTLCEKLSIPPADDITGKRTANASYKCSPALHSSSPFACHVGDLYGKYGPGTDVSSSPVLADLRILSVDEHNENPCLVGERMLPLVVSCNTTGRELACSPFRILGTSRDLLLSDVERLLVETATILSTSFPSTLQLLGALHAKNELERRVQFLEDAASDSDAPSPSTTSTTPPITTLPAPSSTGTSPSTSTTTAPPYPTSTSRSRSTRSTSTSTPSTTTHTYSTHPHPLPGPPTEPAPTPPTRPPRKRRPLPRPPLPSPPEPTPAPIPQPPSPGPIPGPPEDDIPGPPPPNPPGPSPTPPPRRRRRRPWLPDPEE